MTVSAERIAAAALEVLESAALENPEEMLDAAEILRRLPRGLRIALRAEYKAPRGAGECFTAQMRVAQVVARMPEVEHRHGGGVDSVRCSAYGIPGTRVVASSYRIDSRPPRAEHHEQSVNTAVDASDACTPKAGSGRAKSD